MPLQTTPLQITPFPWVWFLIFVLIFILGLSALIVFSVFIVLFLLKKATKRNVVKHSIIVAASLVILYSTLLVPKTVNNKTEQRAMRCGLPFHFVAADLSQYDPPFPHRGMCMEGNKDEWGSTDILWPQFFGSLLVILMALEGLLFGFIFLKNKQKNTPRPPS